MCRKKPHQLIGSDRQAFFPDNRNDLVEISIAPDVALRRHATLREPNNELVHNECISQRKVWKPIWRHQWQLSDQFRGRPEVSPPLNMSSRRRKYGFTQQLARIVINDHTIGLSGSKAAQHSYAVSFSKTAVPGDAVRAAQRGRQLRSRRGANTETLETSQTGLSYQSPVTRAGAPRSPAPTVALAIASMRSSGFFAARRSVSSSLMRGSRSRSAMYSFSSVLSAM